MKLCNISTFPHWGRRTVYSTDNKSSRLNSCFEFLNFLILVKMLDPIVWQIWPKLRLSKPNSVWFLWTSRYVVVSLIWRTVEVLLETLLLSVSSCFVRTKSCFPRFKNLQWIRKSLAQRLMLDCLFAPVITKGSPAFPK